MKARSAMSTYRWYAMPRRPRKRGASCESFIDCRNRGAESISRASRVRRRFQLVWRAKCIVWSLSMVWQAAMFLSLAFSIGALAAEPDERELQRQFAATALPFLKTYCHDCHGSEK